MLISKQHIVLVLWRLVERNWNDGVIIPPSLKTWLSRSLSELVTRFKVSYICYCTTSVISLMCLEAYCILYPSCFSNIYFIQKYLCSMCYVSRDFGLNKFFPMDVEKLGLAAITYHSSIISFTSLKSQFQTEAVINGVCCCKNKRIVWYMMQ